MNKPTIVTIGQSFVVIVAGATEQQVLDHLANYGQQQDSSPLAFLNDLDAPVAVTVPVNSSWIESATYNLQNGDLLLNTKDESAIELYGVPLDEFKTIVSLKHGVGTYYHDNLKRNYK